MKTTETIEDKEFEAWKDKYREVFKDTPESMDLINLNLKWLDENPEGEKAEQRNIALKSFYENELAHSGELKCKHCGSDMEVYNTAQCFHCDESKPKIEDNEGNYICATKWISNREEGFDEDALWSELCDRNILKGNDTYMKLYDSDSDDAYGRNVKIFKKHFDIEKTKWFVSW